MNHRLLPLLALAAAALATTLTLGGTTLLLHGASPDAPPPLQLLATRDCADPGAASRPDCPPPLRLARD